jgi:hypothetical protein
LVSEKQTKGQFTTTLAITKPSGAESASDQLTLIVFIKPLSKELQVQELQTRLADALKVQLNTRKNIALGKVITPWKTNADKIVFDGIAFRPTGKANEPAEIKSVTLVPEYFAEIRMR